MLSRQLYTQVWSSVIRVGNINFIVISIEIVIKAIRVLDPAAGEQHRILVLTFQ